MWTRGEGSPVKYCRSGEKIVTFYNYHLDTGNSCGSPSESTVQDFMRWADDEASPAELVFLQARRIDV